VEPKRQTFSNLLQRQRWTYRTTAPRPTWFACDVR